MALQIVTNFKDKNFEFLSNFYILPDPIKFMDLEWMHVEGAYQAAKSQDVNIIRQFQMLSPSEAKMAGKQIVIRKDWHLVRDSIMYKLLKLKFALPELRDKLLSTNDALLVEGNTWHDNYWGRCFCEKCSKAGNRLNMLGRMLMQIRMEITEDSRHSGFERSKCPDCVP